MYQAFGNSIAETHISQEHWIKPYYLIRIYRLFDVVMEYPTWNLIEVQMRPSMAQKQWSSAREH